MKFYSLCLLIELTLDIYINCILLSFNAFRNISPCSCPVFLFVPFFSESYHMFHRVLELLCDAVLLLRDSVCELVWDDCSLVGMELASQNITH